MKILINKHRLMLWLGYKRLEVPTSREIVFIYTHPYIIFPNVSATFVTVVSVKFLLQVIFTSIENLETLEE